MKPTIYKFDDKEIHMMGDYVGVVSYSGGMWFISFPWIRINRSNGTAWEDEDSSVSGGISADQAEIVAVELMAAAKHLRELLG